MCYKILVTLCEGYGGTPDSPLYRIYTGNLKIEIHVCGRARFYPTMKLSVVSQIKIRVGFYICWYKLRNGQINETETDRVYTQRRTLFEVVSCLFEGVYFKRRKIRRKMHYVINFTAI